MRLRPTSLRTRLLLAYTGLIVLGFAGLTLFAGGQISNAARTDFERQLTGTITLIAGNLSRQLEGIEHRHDRQNIINRTVNGFRDQINGQIVFQPPEMFRGGPQIGRRDMLRDVFDNNAVDFDRRNDLLITSVPVAANDRIEGIIQLQVSASSLDQAVMQRWLELGAGFLTLTFLSLLASTWLARTLIQPLRILQDSARTLAQGDFSHRVTYSGIDEIGAVTDAFNEMAFQVESMLEEQRAFASNTSHELRTPLTTIRLRTEALRYDTTLDTDLKQQYISEIDNEVIRLSALVTDLTLLSRLDAGRAELGQDEIDFARFMEHLQGQIQSRLQAKQLTLQLKSPDKAALLRMSLTHLDVTFRNLLDNAIKYTPEGGQIEWSAALHGGQLHSQIKDSGRGIAAEHMPHLFERFYRADRARTRHIPGTGLGLALVQSIVRAYGGSVKIDSPGINQGTTATVMLPLN